MSVASSKRQEQATVNSARNLQGSPLKPKPQMKSLLNNIKTERTHGVEFTIETASDTSKYFNKHSSVLETRAKDRKNSPGGKSQLQNRENLGSLRPLSQLDQLGR